MRDYTFADWRRLRPLTHMMKTLRYRLVDALYMRRPPRSGDIGALAAALRGRKVLVTIAFSDVQAIAWQIPLLRHYLPHTLHVIADNTPDDATAARIAAEAERAGVAYLRLPHNPWEAGSRSHGIALNWVWHNLVRRGEPEAFGFLDHDIFPTAAEDPFVPLARQDFYGVLRPAGERWFLWAGYCTFRFDRVRDKPLDFGQDWFVGLDTGGGNWEVLYRHVDRAAFADAPTVFLPFKPGLDVADGPIQWCGAWLHEIGLMGRPELGAEKRAAVAAILAPHLAAAGAAPASAPPPRLSAVS